VRKGGKPPAKGNARGAPPNSGGRDRRGRGEDREARKEAGRKTAAGRAAVARSSRPDQRDEPRRIAKPTGYRPREDRPPGRSARVVEGAYDPQYLRGSPEAPVRTKREAKAEASETIATGVQTLVVTDDEANMRVDRFLIARFPQLPFSHIQRIAR